ncbi:MAG: diaminopimelate epimerase [Ignavibacteria bacterium]
MIDFKRYSGAGNKFLILNNLGSSINSNRDVVIELMQENSGFDGVIFVEPSSIADYKMNYFNKDGTGDALCGNGLRCTARFLKDEGFINNEIVLIEGVGKIYDCRFIDDGEISVGFPPPAKMKFNFKLKVHFEEWWQLINASYVDVGSPHVIIFVEDIEKPIVNNLDEIPLDEWGKYVRMHKDFLPDGVNSHFVKVIDAEKGELQIRSFERGVEGETLACGTGSLSSAISAYAVKSVKTPVRLLTRSGEYLTVNFSVVEGVIRELKLKGGAVEI